MNKTWKQSLSDKLIEILGQQEGNKLADKYINILPKDYHNNFAIDYIANDIFEMEKLSENNPLSLSFYNSTSEDKNLIHIKIYQYNMLIALSDIMPIFGNLNVRIINEKIYEIYKIGLSENNNIYISDFSASISPTDFLEDNKATFKDAFLHIWNKHVENDELNSLILKANLSWREVSILRAYTKYIQQIGIHFDQIFLEHILIKHARVSHELINLFFAYFDSENLQKDQSHIENQEKLILEAIDQVSNLDEDKILRYYFQLIKATLRTNYFQKDSFGESKRYIAIKINSTLVPELPLPKPLYEIFVYSANFEGIHLRSSKISRGGIRWSERYGDFRTEILGLMKAQTVKNSIIAPSGAKGGFVVKDLAEDASREIIQAKVRLSYKNFICALLDLTDNLQEGKIINPENTICLDDADPYLVVAADKGTAAFSDIANAIALQYGFWLGDAFASGGSAGYDHKELGITARGAWESVKRSFKELDINFEKFPITAIGIGDMSGDVFGNGMLYSRNINLVAAFDHRHIFIDPNPNAETAYVERKRLFDLPHSSWEDYNPALISAGGGIYRRTLKSISISSQLKKLLSIQEDFIEPNNLIRLLLQTPVDLLWNGGIGTFVKSNSEKHIDVGDKFNDPIRINGSELKCRVVGEGGNLGFTQLGRVEYALNGGKIYTDFIDNSAGVNCSDIEVNIKILLDDLINKNKLSQEERNPLLEQLTEEVSQLVLNNNYHQSFAVTISTLRANMQIEFFETYINYLENNANLNRVVEFIPDHKQLLERMTQGKGFTQPEVAVIFSYTKNHLKQLILASTLPEDSYIKNIVHDAFPMLLNEKFHDAMYEHPLNREIIATQLGNQMVDYMGIYFVYLIQEEMAASIKEIFMAFTVTMKVFKLDELYKFIGELDTKVPTAKIKEIIFNIQNLISLGTRWFLNNLGPNPDIENIIDVFTKNIDVLAKIIPSIMSGATKDYMLTSIKELSKYGVSESDATRITAIRPLYLALDIIQLCTSHHFDLVETTEIYFEVGIIFKLIWFREQIASEFTSSFWSNYLARVRLRDELDMQQRLLTTIIIQNSQETESVKEKINTWTKKNKHLMEHWKIILTRIQTMPKLDFLILFISIRDLANLTRKVIP